MTLSGLQSGFASKRGDAALERFSYRHEGNEARVALASFNLAHVGAVDACLIRQRFLRQFERLSARTDSVAQTDE